MNIERPVNAPAPMHITDRSSTEDNESAQQSTPLGRAALRVFMVTGCLTATGAIVSPVLGAVVSQSAGFIAASVSLGLGAFSSCLVPYFDSINEDVSDPEHQNA